MIIEWKKVSSKFGAGLMPPDFRTHAGYVELMRVLSSDLKLIFSQKLIDKIIESELLTKKLGLIRLTVESIDGEHAAILKSLEYAQLCVSWISVKAYYLLFNLCLVLEYLIGGDDTAFHRTHKKVLNGIKVRIKKGEIVFSNKEFNAAHPAIVVSNIKIKTGSNIKLANYDPQERISQILKKLVDYQLEDFQRNNSIKDFRSKINRNKKAEFLKNNEVALFEFFYWYRIKANYRDLEFLSHDISDADFANFYANYYLLTKSFYKCFKDLINNLSMIRLGKEIIN